MNLTDYVIVDIEANGLLDTVDSIHCIVLRDKSGFKNVFHDGRPLGTYHHMGDINDGINEMVNYAKRGFSLVGHNLCGFDFPMLKKLRKDYHYQDHTFNPFNNSNIIDTYMVVSMLFPEEMPGLDYWGRRLGKRKPAHEDWSKLSLEMIERCMADTSINDRLLKHCIKEGLDDPKWIEPLQLEQQVLWIHAHQTMHGMRVNVELASACLDALDKRTDELEKSLHAKLPKTVTVTGVEVSRPFLANGQLSKMSRDWFSECGIKAVSNVFYAGDSLPGCVKVAGPYSRITFENVNLNSHPRVKELLTSLGWKPTKWNYKRDKKGQFERDADGQLIKTSPKLTEDSYDSLPPGVGQELKEYLVLKHRRRFILNESNSNKGLLSYVNESGRVSCDAFTCGTNTARYRHTGAFVNLPKVGSVYGQEIRSIFCVPSNRWLIGIDLKGIEANMTAHYAYFYDGGAYKDIVMTGDVHDNNAKALGCSREVAKTFLYAISYGAGPGKMAEILGCSVKKAKKKIKDFWKANQGVADLITALEREYDVKGYITGLDGRELYIRHKHKLLNTLIQNAATVVFKKWMVECYHENARLSGCHQVLAYHDELGWEYYSYRKRSAEARAEVLAGLATKVGQDLKLHLPITADWKVGKRYSEVH